MTGDPALTLFDLAPDVPSAEPPRELVLPGGRPATPQQREAVERRSGSLLLTATAGSGKTAVLVERFVRAVLDDGVSPARVLAITFTEKAAGELRERVRERFLECDARDAARETEAAFVSTIHGFCARLLRAHALAAGLDPGFTVLDEAQAVALRDEAFDAALERFVASGPPALDLVAAYGADRLAGMVVSAHESLRSRGERVPALPEPAPRDLAAARQALAQARESMRTEAARPGGEAMPPDVADALSACDELLAQPGVPPPGAVAAATLGARSAARTDACGAYAAAAEEFKRACADHHGAAAVSLLAELLREYGSEYRARKRARSALDFDDLELEAWALVASDAAVRAEWSERFELVMVDEFQDTNPRQLALLEALERDNLFCVGDAMQSIYGFRDADVGLFRERRDRLAQAGAALSLTETFRARPEIVSAVNAVFAERPADGFVALEPARTESGEPEPRVELLLTDTSGWDGLDEATALGPAAAAAKPWRRAEAKLLAQRVAELAAGGTALGEIAVLLRASGDLPVYERALEELGLPTVSASGGGFWSRLEVLDLIAYLGFVANPLDEHALYSVLASPLVGASSDALALLATTARDLERGAWRTLEEAFDGDGSAGLAERFGPDDRVACGAFAARMRDERARAARLPIATLLGRAMAASGYEEGLRASASGRRRVRNVEKLLHLARGYEDQHGRDLRGFLDFAAGRMRTPGAEVEAPLPEGEDAAIRVMTIHAAKGLEFDVVCVADLGRAPALSTPDLLVEGDRVGVRVVLLDGRSSVPSLGYEDLREARVAADAAEEDRILFVAMTRASERLLLSGAVDFRRWPKPSRTAPPVSWIAPALVPGIDERLGPGEPLFDAERVEPAAPVFDVAVEAGTQPTAVRCHLSSPATMGTVLRPPPAPPPEVAPQGSPAVASAPAPPVAVGGAVDRVAADAILSYSSLAAYARCGYRYYLEREAGLPEQPAPGGSGRGGLDARARGVLVHELLEALDFAAPAPPDAAAVRSIAGGRGLAVSAGEAQGVADLVAGFASSDLCARLAGARACHREREFTFRLTDGVLVTGVVDVLAWEEDGVALVVDYKSDHVGDADLDQVVTDLYATQRRLYALAALRAGAASVEVVYAFLERPEDPVCAKFEAAHAAELELELRSVAGGLLGGEFPVTEAPHRDLCLTCPGRRALCSWPEEMTMRPGPRPGDVAGAGPTPAG